MKQGFRGATVALCSGNQAAENGESCALIGRNLTRARQDHGKARKSLQRGTAPLACARATELTLGPFSSPTVREGEGTLNCAVGSKSFRGPESQVDVLARPLQVRPGRRRDARAPQRLEIQLYRIGWKGDGKEDHSSNAKRKTEAAYREVFVQSRWVLEANEKVSQS